MWPDFSGVINYSSIVEQVRFVEPASNRKHATLFMNAKYAGTARVEVRVLIRDDERMVS